MSELNLKNNQSSALRNFFILAALIIFLMSGGCRKEIPLERPDPDPEIQQEEPFVYHSPFIDVSGPVRLTYLVNNPMIETYTEVEENEQFRERLLSISSLQDKSVEDIINSKITNLHQSLKEMELPPFRGIRRLIPEGSTLTSEYVTTTMDSNYCNIISVNSTNSRTYDTPDGPDPTNFVEYTDSITLDLRTGEEVMLEDLFVTGSNYKEHLNTLIKSYLNNEYAEDEYSEWFSSIGLVAPFTGIKDTQKFFLTETALSLLIDYETPEFDTNNYSNRIYISFYDLRDILAIKERFYNPEETLFDIDFEKTYSLIDNYSKYIEGERINEKINGVQVYYESRTPKNLPESIADDFINFKEIDMEEIEELSQVNSPESYYSHESTATIIGDFIIFATNKSMYDGNSSRFAAEFRTYRTTGELLDLGDLFITGYNYDEVINNKLLESFPEGYRPDKDELKELMESLTFRLNRTGAYFATHPVKIQENDISPISFQIEYSEFGCENMTIFN